MLTTYFIKPLEMNIGGHQYRFCSVRDFEFALNGRNTVPPNKVIELFNYPNDRLKSEAHAINEVERMLIEILSRSIDSPRIIRRAMKEMDYNIFSNDHHWRSIFIALQDMNGDIGDTLIRLALYKYTQYLQSRLEIIITRYPQTSDNSRAA